MNVTEPTTIEITKTLLVHPKYLHDFKDSLHSFVTNSLKSCYEDFGYILDVSDINQIGPKKIEHSSGHLTILVRIKMTTILPKLGDVYNCCITAIFPEGVVTSYGQMQIFIPTQNMVSEWSVQMNTLKCANTSFSVGDWLYVEIRDVQYSHGNYQCIGQILK